MKWENGILHCQQQLQRQWLCYDGTSHVFPFNVSPKKILNMNHNSQLIEFLSSWKMNFNLKLHYSQSRVQSPEYRILHGASLHEAIKAILFPLHARLPQHPQSEPSCCYCFTFQSSLHCSKVPMHQLHPAHPRRNKTWRRLVEITKMASPTLQPVRTQTENPFSNLFLRAITNR